MESNISNLVTGGAGFLGSHLIDRLMETGQKVICIDNLSTGNKRNVEKWLENKRFNFFNTDIVNPIDLEVDRIWHLACPASPIAYQKDPISTARINFLGTYNMLKLANENKAKILFTSSSEIYGDPEISPQNELYRGSVNNIGIRSCYVEGKRIAESLCYDFKRQYNCDVRVARLFNTYGPRMQPNDGRVISNFITQALQKKDITIYGDGTQTRSFCYVNDLIEGLFLLMNSSYFLPINLGNPKEYSIFEIANFIRSKINKNLNFKYYKLPDDDPQKRMPSITKAKTILKWNPNINIEEGIDKTIHYFVNYLECSKKNKYNLQNS